ncbi:hypothetical protein [Streptomyces sp. BK79]|uniref:hypothetical protein n=1 Tax=Streptomyces sp. BK79 TaxID=3350097 RepID=UPI00376F7A94
MAGSANWRCADCDTYNGPADAFCAACGGTRREAAPAKTPPAAGTAGKGAAKPTPKPAAKAAGSGGGAARPAAKRPGGGGRPPADWRCAKCDTNNARTDLSCIVCGTGWRSTAKKTARKPSPSAKEPPGKKAAPGRTPPKKPSPGRSAPTAPTGRTAPRTASASSRPRPGSPSGTARPRSEEGVFFPSSGTGYRPHPPPARTPAAAPPRPAPVRAPGPRPRATPPRPAKQGGCGSGCLAFVAILFVLGLLSRGCEGLFDQGDDSSGPDVTRTSATCPARIAAELPGGGDAELVKAFRTSNKQITLCRTASGTLYYYGEFSDGREPGIAMEAERTSTGFEARNGVYRYEIHDGVVTIYESGTRIGEETVVPEPSPT